MPGTRTRPSINFINSITVEVTSMYNSVAAVNASKASWNRR